MNNEQIDRLIALDEFFTILWIGVEDYRMIVRIVRSNSEVHAYFSNGECIDLHATPPSDIKVFAEIKP